jgi:uncharacterized protein (TIGR02757 family)
LLDFHQIFDILNRKAKEYNHPSFIINDPICVPHQFSKKQDIEIAAFFAATIAWGNRKSIIQNANRIMKEMNHQPHDFILHHKASDLKSFLDIKHRTFNATDLLYFIHFLQHHYQQFDSLEAGFMQSENCDVKARLASFHHYFFSIEHPARTRKHVSTPIRHSACKRLNMFLRWMVRDDHCGVDFGLWKNIKMSELICPLDIHTSRVGFRLGLISSNKANWQHAEMLTNSLRQFSPNDPCQYDFALFGLGVEERIR